MAINVIHESQIEHQEVNQRDGARVGVRTGELATASMVQVNFGKYIPNIEHWNDGPNVRQMQWPGEAASSHDRFEERNREALAREHAAGYAEDLT